MLAEGREMSDRAVGASIAVVLLLIVAAYFSIDGLPEQAEEESAPIPESTAAAPNEPPLAEPYEPVSLGLNPTLRSGAMACTSKADYEEIVRAMQLDDDLAFEHLARQGRCAATGAEYRTSILDRGGFLRPWVKVRIYGGDDAVVAYVMPSSLVPDTETAP